MPEFRNYGGTTSPTFRRTNVPKYPTTPPPLRRGDIAEIAERRRAASRALQEAIVQRTRGRARAEIDLVNNLRASHRGAAQDRSDSRTHHGARGQAFSPRELGRSFTQIRDTQARSDAEQWSSFAERLAALDAFVNEARSNRDIEISKAGADAARRRTELDRLIRLNAGV